MLKRKGSPVMGLVMFIVLLNFLTFFTGETIYAQKPVFDYKGDTKAVPGEILVTLEAGSYEFKGAAYKILGKAQSGEFIDMKSFHATTSPGDPVLPFRIYDMAVPPNIDWNSLKLTFETETVEVPGEHIVPPVPPLRARVGDEELIDWGEGKDIVAGRNINVYGKKEFYPAEPVKILSRSQMRKWKFVKVGFTPIQYNPVDKKLRLIKSVRVRFTFNRIGTKVFRTDPVLDDKLMDDVAKKRFINFKEAKKWYRYVPAPKSKEYLDDPDYVIITTNDIRDNSTKLTDFVNHKIALGHTVQVVTEDDYGTLAGQPPDGRAENIRAWLAGNYIPMGIKYVLLIGDPDPDDPSLPLADDPVGDLPMKMCWPKRTYYKYRESPTDYFYANLTGNWDLDGDTFFGENTDIANPTSPDASIAPDTFSVRWTGRIETGSSGLHRFLTNSDEGMRVSIDGIWIIDDWTPHYPHTEYGSIDLAPGQYDIVVEFFDDSGDALAGLWWRPPGEDYYNIVPSANLYHLVGGVYVSGGLDGEYFDSSDFTASTLTRVDGTINFVWGTGDKGAGGVDFTPDVYVGRIPVYAADYATLDDILQKIIDYETALSPAWRRKFMTANVYLWEPQSDYLLGEELKTQVADPLGFTSYRIYESDFGLLDPPECPAINPKDTDPAADCNMLGEWVNGGGCGILTWSTHGSAASASHLISSADCSSLDNSKPAFTFQGSCLNGYPENTGNLGYSLLVNGAIATVSASRVSWNYCFNPPGDPNPSAGNNANLTYYYAEKIMKDSSAGHSLYIAKDNVNPDSYWMNKMDYNIYGDPSTSLFRLWGGVILLFDTSGSMSWRHDGTVGVPEAEQRLTKAKEATYPFMEMLNDHTNHRVNFGIANFPPQPWDGSVGCNGQVQTPMTLVTDSSKDTAVTTTIPGLSAEGNTPLLAGIDTAVGMFGVEDNRAIILLSDGYHNCPGSVAVTDTEVTDLISQLNTESIKVYTIGFGRPTDIDHPLLETLAADTGGQFYDVTTPGFDPLTWDPAIELQATYKAVLVDTLGLQTAADPSGIIQAKKKVVRRVKINKHDRCVSFFLSWVTSRVCRLGLTVKSSDNQPVPINVTGTHFHEGNTYKVISVDSSFLQQPGKVGSTPWRIEIDSYGLDTGEEEHYQYSVIVSSGLNMTTAIDKASYVTGDNMILTARITDHGKPVTGLTDVYAKVIGPEDGLGNWFSANKVSAAELKKVPGQIEDEKLTPLQRKALFLTDIRKVASPGWTVPKDIRLYDDATHGDVTAADGVYTNRFSGTTKEGTYSFYFKAASREGSTHPFDREDTRQTYITVNAAPGYSDVNVLLRDTSIGDNKIPRYIYDVIFTPKDRFGNTMRPGHKVHAAIIYKNGSSGQPVKLNDNLDGTYRGSISISGTDLDKGVKLGIELNGKTFTAVEPPQFGKWSLSLHGGMTFPVTDFGSRFDSSFMFALDLDYHFNRQLSAVAIAGFNHFEAKPAFSYLGNTHWWNFSANLKWEAASYPLRPYVNGGFGLYIPKTGSTKPGFNIGAGVDRSLNPNLVFEVGADYHRILTGEEDPEFYTAHIGFILLF